MSVNLADPKQIFVHAVENYAPERWPEFLADACGANAMLRERVEALLAAYRHPNPLLDGGNLGDTEGLASIAERLGTDIGPYKLLQQIGEGGFGVVYMAEQQRPVRRKVALKVIKPGFDTRQVIARFEAERQALALMDHEHIAKVFDAGATDSGRPYFVMELVHGVPITEFCDRNKLDTRARLELFMQVCRAVQHAHTKGIIHRDIKPTNVLVTLHEGVPVPKVIDFGVAKATGQQLTEKTLFTDFAQMVGTPLYMSPEQAEMTGIDVDTRSDVYSLGVLLYELLTGTTPLDKHRLKQAAFDEVRRIIREDEPQRPSARLNTMGQQARRSVSAYRGSNPEQLGRLVRGELDWIVMKALEKERARRYETAIGLARDIERYLRDEPVEACPPSAWYRFRKFARRNKAALGAASGIALLTLAAAGMLAVSNVRVSEALERERRNSYGQRIDLANREWSANNLSRMEAHLAECPADFRDWEWHYLKRLRYHALSPLRHESFALSVAFSPDGKHLASGTQLGVVRVWDANTGQELQKWTAHEDAAQSVAFSPDGRLLATGSWDGKVKVWEMKNVLEGEVNEPLHQLEHIPRVWTVTFSPNGERLAVAAGRSVESKGEVKVWNLKSPGDVLTLNSSDRVTSVQFSPDGDCLAIAGVRLVELWDAQTGKELLTFPGHEKNYQAVAFSPNGRRLAAVAGVIAVHPDREVKVWDTRSGKSIFSLPGHVGGIRCVAYSPNGHRVISAGVDQTVKLWDAETGREMLTLRGHLDNVFSVAFSSDGYRIASASLDKTVRIWDATPMDGDRGPEYLTYRGHRSAVMDVAFHPKDGRSVVSAGTDGMVRMWDFRSGKGVASINESPSGVGLRVAFSPDGERLATAGTAEVARPVRVWQIAAEKEICRFSGHRDTLFSVAFSPDGRHVASADGGSMIRVWNSKTAEEVQALNVNNVPIFAVTFSPDGRSLASASADSSVRIWDWATGHEPRVLTPAHKGRINGVAFSRDGKLLEVEDSKNYAYGGKGACGDYGGVRDVDTRLVDLALVDPQANNLGILGENYLTRLAEITDGASQTLLVTECAGRPELWRAGHSTPEMYAFGGVWVGGTLILFQGSTPDGATKLGPCAINCTNLQEPYSFHPAGVNADLYGTFACRGRSIHSHRFSSIRVGMRSWDPRHRDRGKENDENSFLARRGGEGRVVKMASVPSLDPFQAQAIWGILANLNPTHIRLSSAARPGIAMKSMISSLVVVALAMASAHAHAADAVDLYGDPLPDGAVARLGTIRFRHSYGFNSRVAFLADGQTLLAGSPKNMMDRALRTINARTGEVLHEFDLQSEGAPLFCLSADGRTLATLSVHIVNEGTELQQRLSLWDAATGRELKQFAQFTWKRDVRPPGEATTLAFSPDNKFLAVGTVVGMGMKPGVVTILSAETGEDLRSLEAKPRESMSTSFSALAFSPRGKLLAIAGEEGVLLWEYYSERKPTLLPESAERVQGVSFSHDGSLLALSSHRHGVPATVYDTAARQPLPALQGAGVLYASRELAFSPDDGRLYVSQIGRRAVEVFDPRTGALLATWDAGAVDGIAIAASLDGKLVAASKRRRPRST